MGAAITGWGTAVPANVVTNEQLAERLDVDAEWIQQRTGISARRIATEKETTTVLATQAALGALRTAEADPGSIDMIILATVTPDHALPASSCLVASAIDAHNASAFDLNAGCSGFLFALAQARSSVEAGDARKVLVIGADVLSRITDYSDHKSCVLFGDGAGAVVVERREGGSRVGPFLLGSDGSHPELLWAPRSTGLISMEGREVYRRAVDAMSRSIVDLCGRAGVDLSSIDLLIAHQANARILEAVAERTGLGPEKVVLDIAGHGNTSAASIPLALAGAVSQGRLSDGDLVMFTAFGAGFTWGAGLVRWGLWANEVRRGRHRVTAHA